MQIPTITTRHPLRESPGIDGAHHDGRHAGVIGVPSTPENAHVKASSQAASPLFLPLYPTRALSGTL